MAESEKTFEEKFQELQSIVQNLEQGEVPLDKALEDFQKGILLSRDLKARLQEADELVAKVIDEDGQEEDFSIKDREEDI